MQAPGSSVSLGNGLSMMPASMGADVPIRTIVEKPDELHFCQMASLKRVACSLICRKTLFQTVGRLISLSSRAVLQDRTAQLSFNSWGRLSNGAENSSIQRRIFPAFLVCSV
jgi:hypothetical protein